MTAPTWTEITDTEIQQGKPIRALTGRALRDNVESVAGRGTGAPWLNGVGAIQQLTGSGNFTVPAGVYRLKGTLKGAGASGRSGTGTSNGGSTTFGAATAPGGAGPLAGSPYVGGLGGVPSATTGALTEILLSGANGHDGTGGVILPSQGGKGGGLHLADGGEGAICIYDGSDDVTKPAMSGRGFGAGGGGDATANTTRGWAGGGEGATVIVVLSVVPGQVIAYSIGAEGTNATAGDGAPGTIILEY